MALSVFSAGAPAQALAGDDSIAESTFLSGTLLENLLPVGLNLGYSSASNDGTQSLQTDTSSIDALVGAAAGVGPVEVPIVLADVGLLGTYAKAANDGSSVAASGLVNASGDVGVAVVDPSGVPSALSLDLTEILVDGFATELTQLKLDVGAVSSRAESVEAAPATGDYEIVGSQLLLTSDTIAGISATVDSLAGTLTGAVDAVVGPGGTLLGTVTSTASAAFDTVGVVSIGDTSASVSLDLPGVIAPLLTEIRTGPAADPGPVTVNLGTGEVVIDLAALHGGTLDDLPANTPVLTADELSAISLAVTAILGDFADELEEVVTAALEEAFVQIDVNLRVKLPLTSVTIPLAQISVSGTLAELADGTGAITADGLVNVIGVKSVVDGLASALVAPLGLVVSPIVAPLIDPEVGALKAFIDGIQTGVITPVANVLNPLLLTLDAIVGLTVNNQELLGESPNQQFVETALRVGLVESLLELDVARSVVGPNNAGVRPVITDVDPTSGPASGGTPVTLTGTDFGGSTGVTFDGSAGTDFTVVSDTEITVTSPAHAAGGVEVIIQHPAGASDAGEFTFTPVPVISSLTPDFGPIAGGTVVTIEGTDFTDATGVTFDGTDGTEFTVDSETQITVTSPAHDLGVVDLVIERTTGNSVPTDFTYRGAPTVSDLSPVLGPLAGGTEVTITGTGFTGSTGVTFDGDLGTSFTIVSDTEITVESPAHDADTIAVVVQHPIGNVDAGDFTYTAAPIISSLSPNIGPVEGGTDVTITGSGFDAATGVTFDGDPVTPFAIVDDNTITLSSPPHDAATVDVVVLSTPADSAPGTFTYQEAPTVTSIAPDEGPLVGGTEVTITGTGFTNATGVSFEGEDGTSFEVVSDTEIIVTTPAGVEGAAAVVVLHPAGNADAGDFTYVAAPTVSAMVPVLGPIAGGTTVTITGTGFTGTTGVTFGGIPATSFDILSETTIEVETPAHSAGPVAVVVEHTGGDVAAGDFTYLASPSVSGLTPSSGPLAGGTVVTITGTGFTGATGVTFDGDAGTLFEVVSDTEITVTSPAHAAGYAAVVVQHPIVNADAGDFTYTAGPAIASMVPPVGPVAGGTVVTITGTGFTNATGVTFDGDVGASFDVVSDAEITVTSPAHAAGAVDVIVTHAAGDSTPEPFTYLADPTVTLVSPNAGPLEGGTEVTITGTGFTGATGVTFDGEDGTSFTVVSDTEITVTSPPHAAGTAAIVIQHPIKDTDAGDFTYAAAGIAIVNSMFPLSGPDTGGTLVTLRGSGFFGATGARFGALWGTDFTVISDTVATVVTPEHEAMWVPAMVASGALEVSTPGFTFELTTLALGEDDGLAFTGSSPTNGALLALMLLGMGAALLISRRPTGRHRA
ncbi:IPT/TIG domain-containing protein [Salinibacterium sp. NK8237]|uniref:IPT/TIG domain-containing protein n=1 Tax=Salinibacterium sp. NK8237 TaxID=2792038 RepID=UPI0018CF625A|nr:IPT/TIG domain-containing protein [Salinibacterium sp. NK8237]MBH0130969.1 IPT/TIG domain-containing protein [Salinibacterium sp. NK8237]